MTASDKKKTVILVVLLIVAGVTWGWIYRSGATASTPAAEAKEAKGKKLPKAVQSAQINLHLLENEPAEEVGRKNLFQYRQAPLPPKPPETSRPFVPPQNSAPPVYVPPTPATPQSKAFRYEGFSSKGGRILASISEGGNTYQVTEGECVMGQYCVRRLTESLLEIEDLQLKSSRTFTRVQ